MNTRVFKVFSGILIAVYLSSVALTGAVYAVPKQAGNEQVQAAKHEPKRGINPETGKVSFIGGGDPVKVPGGSGIRGLSLAERGLAVANAYGREFGLKNPSQELKLLRSEKDSTGKDIVRYQQMYKGVPILSGEMIVNMNTSGDLLSISGEVSSDLMLDTKPAIKAQDARKTALAEMAKLHEVDEAQLTSTDPELWIFDESILVASTRPVELVWRMEVTPKSAPQPIREMVLVNAQTGEISFHINQVDTQTLTWPVYFDIELDEARGWIYGSDYNGHKIDVISTSTLQLVKSFVLVNGAYPRGIALSPDGNELAVAESGASSVLFLNPDTGETIATVIPNTTNNSPFDVIYGRSGRLYSSGSSDYYIHVIDTTTHTETSRSLTEYSLTATRLAISSDKNWLYASRSSGSPMKLFKFNVSTDTIPAPTSTPHTAGFSASMYILDPVNNFIFTDTGQVWSENLKGRIGSIGASGQVAYIPSHNAIAVASSTTNSIVFASAQNFYTLSTYTLQGPMGPIVSQSDGNKLFVSTSNGILPVDLSNFPPGTPGTLPGGSLPYFDLVLDEARGVLYGSNTTGHKIDVVSASTLQVVDEIRFNNGAKPQGLDLSPDGSELAVALNGASSLAFIDTTTRTISALAMPNLDGAIAPFDVKYGRAGRLYSSGTGGTDYLHVFDTPTHTEVGISPYPNTISSSPYLAISADKNSVYANESSNTLRLFNVSTDIPTISRSTSSSFRGTNFLFAADNSKIFTNTGQVWLPNLTAQIGSFTGSGHLVEIPGQGLFAAISTASPGMITFVKSTDYYTASTASIPSVSAVGASAVSSAGDKLFVNTNSGIQVLDISASNPASITIVSGSPQSVEVSYPFQEPLKVKVQNVFGNPIAGITVTFTAPLTGASGTFADKNSNLTTVATDADGIATSPTFTANATAGSYLVRATIPNLAASADFQLTNLTAVTCPIATGSVTGGLFLPYKQYQCGKVGHGVGVGDFNHDGRKDVALSASGAMLIFLQDANGNLSQPRVYSGASYYLAVGDLNNDGLDDIAAIGNGISVFLQKADGSLAYPVTYPTSTGPDAIAVGDINNDGLKDVVISHWNAAVIGVFTQRADGTLNAMMTYPSVAAGYDDIAIGDVNGDGKNDVVKMNGQAYANPNLLVYLQNANGTLDTAVPYSLGCQCLGSGIGIGDVTGDGRSDVVMSYGGNKPDARIAVFAQTADGRLQAAVSYPAYDIPEPVEVGDINSDNLSDVVTLHTGWRQAGVFLQKNDGSLDMESLYPIPYHSYYPQDLSIGDINNDGLPDVLIADYSGLVVLYRSTVIPPTSTPVTPGPGPSPTPGSTSTPGPSPTPVPPSSTGSRRTYTASGGYDTPGTFLCDQSQVICTNGTNVDADNAHRYAADTFVFYNTHHGRNSFDGQGGTIHSTVDFGVGYRNAFWDGYQMVYGDDMAADDVVGHELTHGVTQYTSNLIYAYQSGAINESFSDVWGEFIDQTNNSGNDSDSVKWLMGEDTPLGVIRSMSNPPAYGDPDKMSSPYYYTGSGDNGGVHINSGVNNKAVYLMVEGGTFNGRTITGIGLSKTAAVYYETQVYHLTMGANYNDLYYALIQACQNLIGGADGITSNDCEQVRIAAEAVEMISSYTISGNVQVAGVSLSYTGGTTTSDGSGNYSFSVPYSWSGTVTPSKAGYRFDPVSKSYTNIQSNQMDQDFTAQRVYTVSGNVGIGGATLSYSENGMPKTVTASSNGNYSFQVDANWTGTVTPSKANVTFTPANRSYENVQSDQLTQNYVASLTVVNWNDSGAGSLRQAMGEAASGATIRFSSSLAGRTITLSSSVIVNDKKLILDGSGLSPQVTINGSGTAGFIFNALSAMDIYDLTISNFSDPLRFRADATIRNSTLKGFTGDVIHPYASASLTIMNSTLEDNQGIAVVVSGSATTITNSVLRNNVGGGIQTNGSGSLTITNSVLSGNGGDTILSNGTSLSLINSVIYQNPGGALTLNAAKATIVNSTIAHNSRSTANADIFTNGTNSIDIYNGTIVADTNRVLSLNSSTLNAYNSILLCTHHNECISSYAGTINNVNSIAGSNGTLAEYGLSELADHGGPTPTMALLPSSPLIDAGEDTICANSPVNNIDQRGVTRPQGAYCDIGAYEYVDTTVPTVDNFTVTTPTNTLNIPITTFTASDDVAVTGYLITTTSTPPLVGDSNWSSTAPTVYTVASDGTYTLYPWAKDAAGNVSSASATPAHVVVDVTAPAVSSIVRGGTNPSSAASVDFTVTFSEEVTGVSTTVPFDDFSLITSGVTGASITGASGTGSTWTVTVNTGSGDGTIHLDVPNTATITDLAGNSLGSLPFTGGETYAIEKTPGTGIYDDSDANWKYTGTFTTYASSSAYQGGIRYTTTVGNSAEFTFRGSQISILYTGNTTRGKVDVFLDNNPTKLATFDEYTASAVYQKKWTSGNLGAGTHTIKLVHAGAAGKMINIDAIEVGTYQAPVVPGTGTYDDSDANWKYTGNFVTFASTSAYQGGIRYTTTVGDFAEFTFSGSQISLLYTGNTNRGKVDVFLDNNPTKLTTFDEYTATAVYQKKWTSGDLGAGVHTVKLVHAGASDKMINLDAIEVGTYQPPVAPGAGMYDDSDTNWKYTGTFTTFASSSAYQGGIHYTTTVGDFAEFTFSGSQISILYTGNTNRGKVDVFLDNNPTKLATFDEYTATAVYQKKWTSGDLGAGTHTVKLVHAGAAGKMINLDAIEVGTYQAPGAGTYDDTHAGWKYTGSFTTFASTSAYQGGIHYTTTAGDSAEFTFTGSQLILVYTGNTNRGKVDVFVDGNSIALTTIDEYTASAVFQQHSVAITVGAGTHTVKLVHAGPAGTTINLDAMEVLP